MSKERSRNKWDTPELAGGVVLDGKGGSPHTPGPHRSFSYTIHSRPHSGYQTIQTCDLVHNPETQEKQLVTITASQFNVKRLDVYKVNENLRKIESGLKSLPYECRVLQRGESFEIQTYLPKHISCNDKYDFEHKVLQIVRSV